MTRFCINALVLLVCVVAFVGVPAAAHAQSPIHGIAEFRLGGYYPSIDEEEGLEGEPFADIFGDSHRVLVSYEMGVYLWRGFGALALTGSVGYTSFGGKALVGDGEESDLSEPTDFDVFPLGASLQYRFDVLEKRWSIPIVPVAKGGLDYMLWRIQGPDGDTSSFEGDEARGGKLGWHLAGALHLQLDWIDPRSSASMDTIWGINNTYAFAEYTMLRVDDFGGEGFDLSDDMWTFGLAFEF
jgi:hypothetical protein